MDKGGRRRAVPEVVGFVEEAGVTDMAPVEGKAEGFISVLAIPAEHRAGKGGRRGEGEAQRVSARRRRQQEGASADEGRGSDDGP